ncbi:MAG: bifunctional oligoribonuclease/PAP phosphatase NrnA, partial [Deltaproteobacteria bacterium]|nr:bifunctional oligoribonuclease/PAP phosphatase NrnA [Deltaproteobacteria bacterium]
MKAAVIKELRDRDRWLLASHLNPDGDAIGALIGLGLLLKEMGKEVTLLNLSGVPDMFSFLPESHLVAREVGPALNYDGLA